MADPFEGLPPELEALIRRCDALLVEATGIFAERGVTAASVREWQSVLEELLMRYHTAAWLVGSERDSLPDGGRDTVIELVRSQVEYLDFFARAVREKGEWSAAFAARARSYAPSIKVAYWEGKTFGIPLPAQPAQGTQCHNNCGCEWDVKTLSKATGDYDAYWRRGKEDSCQTCIQRAAEWNPVRIRGGVLQLS